MGKVIDKNAKRAANFVIALGICSTVNSINNTTALDLNTTIVGDLSRPKPSPFGAPKSSIFVATPHSTPLLEIFVTTDSERIPASIFTIFIMFGDWI